MDRSRRRAHRHLVLLVAATGVLYLLSYVALTRLISPAVPTPFGQMIGLAAPRGMGSSTAPPSAAEIRASKRRIAAFRAVYAPLLWIDERTTGTYFASPEEIYGD